MIAYLLVVFRLWAFFGGVIVLRDAIEVIKNNFEPEIKELEAITRGLSSRILTTSSILIALSAFCFLFISYLKLAALLVWILVSLSLWLKVILYSHKIRTGILLGGPLLLVSLVLGVVVTI